MSQQMPAIFLGDRNAISFQNSEATTMAISPVAKKLGIKAGMHAQRWSIQWVWGLSTSPTGLQGRATKGRKAALTAANPRSGAAASV